MNQEATQPQEQEEEDALLKLYDQLVPISRGLAREAKTNPKQFYAKLPRIISGTIVRGMATLIEEVGARDQDLVARVSLLESHPLLNLEAAFKEEEQELPNPNDPNVLFDLLADLAMCLDVLAELADKTPALALRQNELVQRLPTNRAVLELMMKSVKQVMSQQEHPDSDDQVDQVPEEPPPELEPVDDMQSSKTTPRELPAVEKVPPIDPALPPDQQVKVTQETPVPNIATDEPAPMKSDKEGSDGQQVNDSSPSV